MANAPAVQTPEEFLALVKKSRLLDDEQMVAAVEAAGEAKDPKSAAKALLRKGLLTRWQASQLLGGYHALRIGKYKLCDILGKGELGHVFLAEHDQLGRRVALKTLSRKHTQDQDALNRFLEEARKIAGLDHRNIIHFFDIDQEGGRYYLVTEFAEGATLQEHVEKTGPLPFAEAAKLTRQTASGLAFLHEKGITHHDLKPSDIVLNAQGEVKILDVGVGRLRDAMLGDQSPSDLPDGPRYLSPEQVAGQPAGQPSDLFSLGCILYWMLTGGHPFPKADSTFGSVTPVDEIRPDAPAVLAKLCDRLMALKPDERDVSAADVVTRLDSWLGVDEDENAAEVMPSETADSDDATKLGRTDDTEVIDVGVESKTIQDDSVSISTDQPTPASEANAVSISTKRRRPRGSGKSAPKTKPAAKEGKPAAKEGKPAAKEGETTSKRGLVIAGGLVGGLLLLGLIGGLTYAFVLRGDDKQVAQEDTAENGADAASDSEPGGSESSGSESELSDPELSDPELSDPAGPELTDPAPAEPSPEANTNIDDPGATGGTTPTNPPNANDTPQVPEPPKPADPEPPKPADPGPAKPADPKPADPKPADPKPDKPKATATAAGDPLKGIPVRIDLPKLFAEDGSVEATAFKPIVLGPVQLGEKVLCSIYLRGGQGAAPGKQSFTLANAQGGLAERDWEIRLEGSDLSGDNLIATLSLKDDAKLYFQWAEAAGKEPSSEHLRNCILNVNLTIGGASKDLALRKPTQVDPLTIEMERGSVKGRWDLAWPPNSDRLFLEITKLPAPFPNKYVLLPEKPAALDKGEVMIRLGEKEEEQVMVLQVTSTFRRSLELNVVPWAQFDKGAKPEKINKASMIKMEKTVASESQKATLAVQQLAATPVPSNPRAKQQYEQAKNLAAQNAANWVAIAEKMERLKTLHAALNGKGQLPFRVFYRTEAGEVTLLEAK